MSACLDLQGYSWVEFFAGMARCTSETRKRGIPGCKFDLKYCDPEEMSGRSSNFMDISTTSGFALLGLHSTAQGAVCI